MTFFKKYYAWLSGFFVFLLYLLTLAPTVLQIDSGELAAVQAKWGVAHPSGYPLFALLGFLFIKIALPFSAIFKANLLSAVWCSLAVVFFVKSAVLMLERSGFPENWPLGRDYPQKRKKKIGKNGIKPEITMGFPKKGPVAFAAVTAGLILAFSRTFWFQSTSVEVYSLHVFLLCLLIFFLLKAYFAEKNDHEKFPLAPWLVVAVCLALGFANHITFLLIIPGLAFLFFIKEKKIKEAVRKVLLMLAVFFPIVAGFYLLLPLRASQYPMINWGNVTNLKRFIQHVTGRQYNVWMFSSFESAHKNFSYFLKKLPEEFAVVGLLIALGGSYIMYKRFKRMFYFSMITLVVTVFYSINFDILDIDAYFLLAYISLAFFAAFGAAGLIRYFLKRKMNIRVIGIIILIPVVVQFAVNFKYVDQSNNFAFHDYTKAVLQSTEENSIIFSYQWDLFVSQSYYFQFVENFRSDIAIIDKELLRRSWYYDQVRAQHADVLTGIEKDVERFLVELAPFEEGGEFNPEQLDFYFKKVMAGLISENYGKREFYIGPEIIFDDMNRGEFVLPDGFTVVPHLFLYKVIRAGEGYIPAPLPDFDIRMPKQKSSYIQYMERMIVTVLLNRAAYELQYSNRDRAKAFVQKAARDFPRFDIHPQLRELLN